MMAKQWNIYTRVNKEDLKEMRRLVRLFLEQRLRNTKGTWVMVTLKRFKSFLRRRRIKSPILERIKKHSRIHYALFWKVVFDYLKERGLPYILLKERYYKGKLFDRKILIILREEDIQRGDIYGL